MKLKKFWIIVIALIGALFFLMLKFVPTNSAELSASENSTPQSMNESYTITLITGDQVSVNINSEGLQTVDITPAERDGYEVNFERIEVDEDVYVIPEDVLLYIPEKLDRELFNVTKLSREGYHDENMDYIPLIITLKEQSSLKEVKKENTQMFDNSIVNQHVFSSINGMSAHVNKGQVQSFNKALFFENDDTFQSTELFSNTIEQIRLDRQVKTSLEDSVPQIGAPKAWESDYDGTGVVVAVLDTGIDSNHPDLTGKIVEARNFSLDKNVEDLNGHGTHVASTIAGSGAASNGDRKGVAPGSTLINAKVLQQHGIGFESSIIQGMEWSVEKGATIVNMSIGSIPTDGTDPISQAVNAISVKDNILFVIAAGNTGPTEQTVVAPGVADLALTVGAVDKFNELAYFSSRGPRIKDYSIKPDITAPGVGIIAARANNTNMGIPLNSNYTQESGTSMAAPHIAGAAALVTEKWNKKNMVISSSYLKSILISTAKTHNDYTIYEQGGGRVDVERALSQEVFANVGSLHMGFFKYPHETYEPVTKTINYQNMSTDDIVLVLEVDISSEDKKNIPDNMVNISNKVLEIKAGSSEEVNITVDPSLGEIGLYGGYIKAESTDKDIIIHTSIGFYNEPEMYGLTIKGITREGGPADSKSQMDVINAKDRRIFAQTVLSSWNKDGEMELRVPPGTYSVLGVIKSNDIATMVGKPELEIENDTTIILDARKGEEIIVNLEDKADLKSLGITYHRAMEEVGSHTHSYVSKDRVFATPTDPIDIGKFEFYTDWEFVSPVENDDLYVYKLIFPEPHAIPANMNYKVINKNIAQIKTQYYRHQPSEQYSIFQHHFRPYEFSSFAIASYIDAGKERMEYFIPDNTRYRKKVSSRANGVSIDEATTYYEQGGKEVTWYKQPMRPSLQLGNPPLRSHEPVYRQNNQLNVLLPEYVDADNHWGYVGNISNFKLFQGEELIAEARRPRGTFSISSNPEKYRMELTVNMGERWSPFSTTTRTNWTFHSEKPSGNEQVNVPLLLVNYDKDLNLDNSDKLPSEADGPNTLDLHVVHQPGVEGLTVEGARLWLSYNDGEDWKEIKNIQHFGEGHFQANLDRGDHDGSGYVSLKVEAWDTEQNKIEQEIIRAYRVADK